MAPDCAQARPTWNTAAIASAIAGLVFMWFLCVRAGCRRSSKRRSNFPPGRMVHTPAERLYPLREILRVGDCFRNDIRSSPASYDASSASILRPGGNVASRLVIGHVGD